MSSPHRFAVRRQVYTPADGNGVRRHLPEKHDRVATFAKADQAFADCAKRLAEFRRTTNPFQLGGPCLFYQTNLPAFAFHDYLLDHNITPPPTSLTANPNYVFWWVKNNRTFSDRDREVVWSACDKLKPFDVIEEDDRTAVYVHLRDVVVTGFRTEHETWRVLPDGGLVRSAFSTSKAARRAMAAFDEWERLEYETVARDAEATYPRFSQVVLVHGQRGGLGNCRIVVRQSYAGDHGGYELDGSEPPCNLGARHPLAVSPDLRAASDLEKRLLASARRRVNPFALCWGMRDIDLSSLQAAEDEEAGHLPNGLTTDDAIEIVRKLPTIPPAPGVLSAEWYDRVVQWSPEFIDVIWSTFADFRLFEVIEVPLG